MSDTETAEVQVIGLAKARDRQGNEWSVLKVADTEQPYMIVCRPAEGQDVGARDCATLEEVVECLKPALEMDWALPRLLAQLTPGTKPAV